MWDYQRSPSFGTNSYPTLWNFGKSCSPATFKMGICDGSVEGISVYPLCDVSPNLLGSEKNTTGPIIHIIKHQKKIDG